MSPRSDPLWVELARRDLVAVVEHVAVRLALPPDVACLACGGCLPGDGPDERAYRRGTTGWGEGVAS